MTTVLKPGESFPDNARTHLVGSDPNLYVRPTAGGNASGGSEIGGSSNAPAGSVPANPIVSSLSEFGAPPSAGGTQSGPNMGHGATQILSGISGGGDTDNDGDTL